MKLGIAVFVASLIAGFFAAFYYPATKSEAIVPPRSGQPHSDTFTVSGYGDLQPLNPVTQKLKNQPQNARIISYGLRVASGCSLGTIASDLQTITDQNAPVLKFTLQRNDSVYDFLVIVNCGNTQINLCGSINIFCLPYGFPYKNDVSISDIISTYPPVSRRAILWHEIIGHAIATFNEQYCLGTETSGVCANSNQFAPAPNWQDIMNTGTESRRDIGDCIICQERWERVMYELVVNCSNIGFDSCTQRWRFQDGWSWEPATGIWYDSLNRPMFGPCNNDRLRLDLLDVQDGFRWRIPNQPLGFYTELSQFVTVPAC